MDPFLGQVQAFGFGFVPRGWAICQGQLLNISTNSALFALLGTTFGGNGSTNFGVPDLQGRTIVGVGTSTSGLGTVTWGQKAGNETLGLTTANTPAHNHIIVNGNGSPGTVLVSTTVQTVNNEYESAESNNGANVLGTSGNMPSIYRESPSGNDYLGGVASSFTGSTAMAGGSVPANIRNPYVGLVYGIATTGIFPSRG
jgi:microcystin-dependent protein